MTGWSVGGHRGNGEGNLPEGPARGKKAVELTLFGNYRYLKSKKHVTHSQVKAKWVGDLIYEKRNFQGGCWDAEAREVEWEQKQRQVGEGTKDADEKGQDKQHRRQSLKLLSQSRKRPSSGTASFCSSHRQSVCHMLL